MWNMCLIQCGQPNKKTYHVNWGLFIPTIYGEFGDGWLVNMNSHYMRPCEYMWMHKSLTHDWTEIRMRCPGWWYTYPSEKYEFVSWGWFFQLNGSHKSHVPNHQPAAILTRIHRMFPRPQEPGCSFVASILVILHVPQPLDPNPQGQSPIYWWFTCDFHGHFPWKTLNKYRTSILCWSPSNEQMILTQLPCVVFSS